jgi:2-oxoglutarate dehydrogenase complex dehydrogenase (E1) component-like enzyme
MYKKIAKMTPVTTLYEKQLITEGVLSQEQADSMKSKIFNTID